MYKITFPVVVLLHPCRSAGRGRVLMYASDTFFFHTSVPRARRLPFSSHRQKHIYIIIYREKKAPRRLRSWVVGDEFRRWAPRRLRSWVRSHIPADPDRRSQPEPPSVAAQSSS